MCNVDGNTVVPNLIKFMSHKHAITDFGHVGQQKLAVNTT